MSVPMFRGVPLDAEVRQRFLCKVAVCGPDECWPWIGTKGKCGYGRFKLGPRFVRAHRVALQLARPIENLEDFYALHSCDNRECVNPAHLRWGTNHDNIADAISRDRFHRWHGRRRGEANKKARLTEQAVREIRLSTDGGMQLAARYGVSFSAIRRVITWESWHHVD